jgi:hypothetical protein
MIWSIFTQEVTYRSRSIAVLDFLYEQLFLIGRAAIVAL